MKKFLFIRFGIGVFDENWYEYRLKLFEIFTLASFENLEQADDLLIFLLIDSNMPLSIKRKLVNIIFKSKLRGQIYMQEQDFMYEVSNTCKKLVEEYCDDGEFVIMGRIDMDDALSGSTFRIIEDFVSTHKNEEVLITFPRLYEFYIEEKCLCENIREFMSVGTFWVTNNRTIGVYDAPHPDQELLAKKMGINIHVFEDTVSLYNVYRDNVSFYSITNSSNELFEKEFKQKKKIAENNDCFDILCKYFGISINKLDEYYNIYPKTPNNRITFPEWSNHFTKFDEAIKPLLRSNKEEFIKFRKESIYINDNKYNSTNDIYEEYYYTVNKWFEMRLEKIYIGDYLLKNKYNNIAIYGIGSLGKLLYRDLLISGVNVKYYIERDKDDVFDNSLIGYKLGDIGKAEKVDLIIVTSLKYYNNIRNKIGILCDYEVVSLNELVNSIYNEHN